MEKTTPQTKKTQDLVASNVIKQILETTPKKYIKQRQGRGGKTLDYVETGYVISKLNEVFNFLWDFEIVEKTIGRKHVVVEGKLTVYLSPELKISKSQYGGAEIKTLRNSDEAVDPADDLKAAASDALKKCASLFGIAQDVYWKNGQEFEDRDQEESSVDAESSNETTDGEQTAMLYCSTCGKPAHKKSGVSKAGKEWTALFCSTDDRTHTEFI